MHYNPAYQTYFLWIVSVESRRDDLSSKIMGKFKINQVKVRGVIVLLLLH